MITSTENYTKNTNKQTKKKTDRQNPGQMVKAKLYRQNHTKKHTHTHSQKEKKEKNICICEKIKKRATKSINKSTNDKKL